MMKKKQKTIKTDEKEKNKTMKNDSKERKNNEK